MVTTDTWDLIKIKKKTCTAKEAVHWVQIYMAYRMVEDTVIHLAEY